MNKKGFTLIELIVVITVMALISWTGVVYFFKQVSSLKISSEISKIKDIISDLDSKIDTKIILDYSILIKKSDKLGFVYTTNNLWLDYKQELELDFKSWTGILWTTKTSTWSNYSFKIYNWIKFKWNNVIDSNESFTGSFLENTNHKIVWTLSWSILNNIYINYYSNDNVIINNENTLNLNYINLLFDKSWTEYNSIEIKNINWKKSIITDWGIWINSIYLFFERDWVEKYIEIKQ